MALTKFSRVINLVLFSVLLIAFAGWLSRNSRLYGSTARTLSVVHQLDVGGTVTSNTSGLINCGSDCQEVIEQGTTITLTATPSAGRAFYRWYTQGAYCAEASSSFHTGTTCTIAAGYLNVTVEANWVYEKYNVIVQKTGSGSGTVTSSPSGINCGSTCTAGYSYPTSFTLSATPSSDSTFAYWDYTGADICANGDKGSLGEVNTNAICSDKTWNIYRQNYIAIVRFEKKASTTTSSSPSSSQQNTTTTTPATVAKLEAPKLATIKIGDQSVDVSKPISVPADKQLFLSGKTVPNGIVTLYIFSEPKTATTTADAEGNWSYAVSDLPPGEHHVEIETKDPSTNQTSDRAQLLAFTVTAADTPSVVAESIRPVKYSKPLFIGFGILVAALSLGGGYWWLMRHRKATKLSEKPAESTETDQSHPEN